MVNSDDDVIQSVVPVEQSEAAQAHAVTTPAPSQPLEIQDGTTQKTKRSRLRFFTILICLYLVIFIGALDQTIIATSIPTIAADLNSATSYAWFASAYLLASAATGPLWAKFSDIWGRKPALLGAVAWFGVGSLIAALSTSARMLIAARAVQGTAAGGLGVLSSITFADLFSVRNRSLYLGLREVVWALAGGVGPLIGGALTQYASWRWNFWINLPVCGVAFFLLLIFLDVHQPRTKFKDGVVAFDWLGATLILGVTIMILLGLDFGGVEFSWHSPTVLCLLIFGTLAIGVFLYTEKSLAKHPLIPLRVFQNRSANAAFAIGFLNGMVYITYPYYIPLYLQSTKIFSPFRSGLLILPLILPGTTAGFLSGIVIQRTGRYCEFIWAGLSLTVLSTGLYTTLSPATPVAVIAVYEALGGIALALLFQAPILVIQNFVTQKDTSAATATYGFLRNISSASSLVIGGVVFQAGMDRRVPSLGLPANLAGAFSGGAAAANVKLVRMIADPVERAKVQGVFAASLRDMWIMYACLAGLGLLLSGFIRHVDLKTKHTETRTGIEKREQTNTSDA